MMEQNKLSDDIPPVVPNNSKDMELPQESLEDNSTNHNPEKENQEDMELPQESLEDNSANHNPEKENQGRHKGKKRRSNEDAQSKRKRRKHFNYSFTNSLMRLNELKPGLKYCNESQEGPPHNPVFCISVEVNNEKFYGKGSSKQKAKHDAAKQALSSFIQFENMPLSTRFLPSGTNDQDFTSDDGKHNEIVNGDNMEKTPKAKRDKTQKDHLEDIDRKNPCMVLNSIQPGLSYILMQENLNDRSKRFQMSISFEGETYEGFGPNKKSAKAAAARDLLTRKFNINFNTTELEIPNIMNQNDAEVFNFPQNVVDAIGKAVFDKFSEVISLCPEYAKWKVLAGIVMSDDENMENLQVISLGTGTKHLNGEYMSMTGGSLNDCHAEIISRRCLKDFFYSQLELHLQSRGEDSIFEQKCDDKFVLKPNYKFHLYITTSPCGDARVFSVHDEDITKFDPHPNRKARGLLRTKIESGEGTIPVKKGDGIQTWDGIIQGQQRYLTMSCSDKVASWNVLGLQGCLLSHFIEPIYLHSIVLGRLFHPTHMRRAIFNRFEGPLKNLPEQYHLNKPKLCATTNVENSQSTASPNFSVNWAVGNDHPEVVTTRTGKTVQNQVSRISKSSLSKRFRDIYTFFHDSSKIDDCTYAEVKNLVCDYRKAKSEMISAFSTGGYGIWVAKPAEQDYFTISR